MYIYPCLFSPGLHQVYATIGTWESFNQINGQGCRYI